MDVKLLIDDIVRQTTVLIAQLSTASGIRAPLSHVANQVFVELARELEAQGVRRKVVADMFGLALRSYQLKVQRLTDDPTPPSTLWQEVHDSLAESTRTRQELFQGLKPATDTDIAAVLNDLVGSGLAYSSGRGAATVYGLTTEADRRRLSRSDALDAAVHMVWVFIATGRARTRAQLATELSLAGDVLDEALTVVLADGRVVESSGRLRALSLHIPVGAEHGWEASVSDHFRAVASSIAAKLRTARSSADDRIGGATLSFSVPAGHPFEAEVYGLLQRVRSDVNALWKAVSEHNEHNPPPDNSPRVTFYFGQNVTGAETREASLRDVRSRKDEQTA